MSVFGPIGFAAPWLLWAALALPVIWLLLRVIPPAPILRRFPGVVLLLGLADKDVAAIRTPLWLLVLRVLALGLVILGFAGPILNPDAHLPGKGPLLILADAGWADAGDWAKKRTRLMTALDQAVSDGRAVAFVSLTDSGVPQTRFGNGTELQPKLAGIEPRAWEPDPAFMAAVAATLPQGDFESLWLSDGLAREGRSQLLQALQDHGAVAVVEGARDVLALRPAEIVDGKVTTTLLRPRALGAAHVLVRARGLDPSGVERELATVAVDLAAGERTKAVGLDLPGELRNRLTRIEVADQASAGAVALVGDALKRRKVALVEGGLAREGLELLSPGHYLREALSPSADVIEGRLSDLLPASPQVVILADVAHFAPGEAEALAEWVDKGGLLVRFSGPRLAAAIGLDGSTDPLLPVPLRPGDRSLGGTMSWGAPRSVAAFPEGSPFHGLAVPAEVTVKAQVLAEPGPDLADHTIAALTDGTPLVTRSQHGKGQVVLFHVTANAEWSNLPLSGLFVEMLDRLAISSMPSRANPEDLKGTVWVADRLMDAYGGLAPGTAQAGVAGEKLASGRVAADLPPGIYVSGAQQMALNVITPDRSLVPMPWPQSVKVEGLERAIALPLKGWVLAVALVLGLLDGLATLMVSGRMPRRAVAAVLIGLLVPLHPQATMAQEAAVPQKQIDAAGGMVLAHVLTGDARVDDQAEAGLFGLSQVLTMRTTVEPQNPVGVDLDTDELAVYSFLYWPVTPDQKAPSPAAYQRLNRFLETGGLILFDTRDGDIAGDGTATPESQRLQALAAPLDIPPLEPVPADHVLTRSFYLLQDFPGRFSGGPVWVEAAPPGAEKAEGMPFRNLNDGVTPVVVGGNDWAGAWAIDRDGQPLYPVGRGAAGDRQRELAYRFGINLIMHVLTGNYKSDQVHVPALLERLGQ